MCNLQRKYPEMQLQDWCKVNKYLRNNTRARAQP